MITAFIIGRVIFGLYWLMAAYGHLFNSGTMVGYAQMKGVPSPKAAIIGSGILLLLGGISMLLGLSPKIGLVLLIIFLLGVTFKMHAFWKVADPMAKMGDRVQFMKNMALLGALLMMYVIASPWPVSLHW